MLVLLLATAWGATLAVMSGEPITPQRPFSPLHDTTPISVEERGDEVVASFDEGWLELRAGGRPVHLHFEADWDSLATWDGTRWRFEGDGAEQHALQAAVCDRVWVERASDQGDPAREASRLRRFVDQHRGGLDETSVQRALDTGLGIIAYNAASATPPMDLFHGETWYRDLASALGLEPTVRDTPTFWLFGWQYGRMAGGVTAQGAVAAVNQVIGRTDATARDPAVVGTVEWALESADTAEEIEAAAAAVERWGEAGGDPRIVALYRHKAEVKSRTAPGRPIPEFEALGLDGEVHTDQELIGKVTVIDFWGTWCGPCIAAIPKWKALAAEYGDRVRFVAIAQEEPGSLPRWRATLAHNDWTEGTLHLIREDRALEESFAVQRYPTYVVLDDAGRFLVPTAEGLPEIVRTLDATLGTATPGVR